MVKAQIFEFKKYYDLIQYGNYYRLTDPLKTKDYHCWQFAAEDRSEALLCIVALQIRPNGPPDAGPGFADWIRRAPMKLTGKNIRETF